MMKKATPLLIFISFNLIIAYLLFNNESTKIQKESSIPQEAYLIEKDTVSGNERVQSISESLKLETSKPSFLSKHVTGSIQKGIIADSSVLKDFNKITPALIAGAGYKTMQMSNTVSQSTIENFLLKNNFTKEYIKKNSANIYKTVKSKSFNRVTLAVTAYAASHAATSYFLPGLTLFQTILVALSITSFLVLIYHYFIKRGVLN